MHRSHPQQQRTTSTSAQAFSSTPTTGLLVNLSDDDIDYSDRNSSNTIPLTSHRRHEAASLSSSASPSIRFDTTSGTPRHSGHVRASDDDEDDRIFDPSSGDDEDEDVELLFNTAPRSGRWRRASQTAAGSTRRRWGIKQVSTSWFLPSTMALTLSLGLTLAPKIQLYYDLLCIGVDLDSNLPSASSLNDPPANLANFDSRSEKVVLSGERGSPEGGEEVERFVKRALDAKAEDEMKAWQEKCKQHPVVKKKVASVALTYVLIGGVLGSLTTGWWGSYSDRKGRKPVLALAAFGCIAVDVTFLIAYYKAGTVPFQIVYLGPIIDGLVGGKPASGAVTTAYLSDITPSGSRSRIFSLAGGIGFAGIALGPTLAALIIKATGSIMVPFGLAMTLLLAYFAAIVLVFPESLSRSNQLIAQQAHLTAKLSSHSTHQHAYTIASRRGPLHVARLKLSHYAEAGLGFLRPLGMLLPRQRRESVGDGEGEREEVPAVYAFKGEPVGKDWSLTKIGASLACHGMVSGVIQVKILYATAILGWGTAETGFYLSYFGVCRVLALVVIVPFALRTFRKPPPTPRRARPASEDHDRTGRGGDFASDEQKEWEREAGWLKVVHDCGFDLTFASACIALEIVAYTIFALTRSIYPFLFATLLSSLASGSGPAINSLALAHAPAGDSGKLLGAFGVLGSVTGSVLGPMVFGATYYLTVDWYPEAIFVGVVMFLGLMLAVLWSMRAELTKLAQ